MKILAVDTATNGCSVALTDGEHLLAEINLVSTQTHSRHLAGMIREVCRLAGVAVGDGLVVGLVGDAPELVVPVVARLA